MRHMRMSLPHWKASILVVVLLVVASIWGQLALAEDPAGGAAGSGQGAAGSEQRSSKSLGTVVDVVIRGNSTVSAEAIKAVLAIKPGMTVTEDMVLADRKAILAMGCFQDAQPYAPPYQYGIRLTWQVQEYPPYKGIVFEGSTIFSSDKLASYVTMKKDVAINVNDLSASLDNIRAAYEAQGYLVGFGQDDEKGLLQDDGLLHVIVHEARVHSISVKGNSKTKEFVIRREIKTVPGELLNYNKLDQDARRIYNLGIFEDVLRKIEPVDDSEVSVDVTFEVVEQKTAEFTGGVSWSSAEGFTAMVGLSEPNFLGLAQGLRLSTEFGAGKKYYEIGYQTPYVGRIPLSLDLSLYNTSKNSELNGTEYVEKRQGGSIGIGKSFGLYTSVTGRLTIDNTKNEWTGDQPQGVTAGGRTHSFDLDYTRNTMDSFTNPTDGGVIYLSGRFAGGILGGDYDFDKYTASISRFVDIRPNHIIGARLKAGFAVGELPSQELFRLGGSESIRGYDDGEFTGQKMALMNIEYRHNFADQLQGVMFVDAGKAFDTNEGLSLKGLKAGAGVGVRLTLVPGLTLRLDYGWGDQGGKLHFSMGQMF